jgi:hypothetical protein
MKDIAPLLATVFVLFSLLGLLSADYSRDSTTSRPLDIHDQHRQVGWLPLLAKLAGAQQAIGVAGGTTEIRGR